MAGRNPKGLREPFGFLQWLHFVPWGWGGDTRWMGIVVATHSRFLDHDTGRGHPERSERIPAVLAGLEPLGDAITFFEPSPASIDQVALMHPRQHIEEVRLRVERGEGRLDADTAVSSASFDAALLGAGAGLETIARLEAGEGEAGFCVVRPPGHHALADTSMGFCLFNNVAIAAASLAERGERVAIVDFDAHHGNGTQALFFDDPRVLFVSLHQFPFYPGTGDLSEMGIGEGWGTTLNVPFPAGTTGDVYRSALNEVVLPELERFQPTWLLYSAGFDAHRADPLTQMGLAAADYADMVADLAQVVPAGRVLAFLEGGYDLQALTAATESFTAALLGENRRPEPPTKGGPGIETVKKVKAHRDQAQPTK